MMKQFSRVLIITSPVLTHKLKRSLICSKREKKFTVGGGGGAFLERPSNYRAPKAVFNVSVVSQMM